MRPPSRRAEILAAVCFSVFAAGAALFYYQPSFQSSSAQTPFVSRRVDPTPATLTDQQPPFDKLELFGMFAAGPIAAYADQVIQKRGCTFKPGPVFLAAFPTPRFQEILRSIKPRVSEASSPDRDAANDLLRQALEATHRRQFSVSDENYRRALKLAPDSATLHLAYAGNFMLMPDGARAAAEARRSLELWSDNAEAHGILSMALMFENKLPESVAEARETLRIFPEHTSAKFQLAASLTKNHQYEEAVPAIRSAIAVLPDFHPLHKFLGISLLETNKTTQAIDELKWYVSVEPSDPEGRHYLDVALRSAAASH